MNGRKTDLKKSLKAGVALFYSTSSCMCAEFPPCSALIVLQKKVQIWLREIWPLIWQTERKNEKLTQRKCSTVSGAGSGGPDVLCQQLLLLIKKRCHTDECGRELACKPVARWTLSLNKCENKKSCESSWVTRVFFWLCCPVSQMKNHLDLYLLVCLFFCRMWLYLQINKIYLYLFHNEGISSHCNEQKSVKGKNVQ